MIGKEEFNMAGLRTMAIMENSELEDPADQLSSWLDGQGINGDEYDSHLLSVARALVMWSADISPVESAYATIGMGFIMGWTCREISEALSAQASGPQAS